MNIFQEALKIKDEFVSKVLPMEYIENGILIHEALSFSAACKLFNIELIIESGIAGGRSTEMYGRFFKIPIIAIDHGLTYGEKRFNDTKARLEKYKHISIMVGDALVLIPQLILIYRNRRIAIHLDGPKGQAAKKIVINSFKHDNVKLAAIHDMCTPNCYHKLDDLNMNVFYSDDREFLKNFRSLDPDAKDKNPNGGGLGLLWRRKESV